MEQALQETRNFVASNCTWIVPSRRGKRRFVGYNGISKLQLIILTQIAGLLVLCNLLHATRLLQQLLHRVSVALGIIHTCIYKWSLHQFNMIWSNAHNLKPLTKSLLCYELTCAVKWKCPLVIFYMWNIRVKLSLLEKLYYSYFILITWHIYKLNLKKRPDL